MKNDNKEIVRTKCNYGGAILGFVLEIILVLIGIYVEWRMFQGIALSVMIVGGSLACMRQYAFSEKGVTIEICHIPIRRIKWKDIKQVGVITYKIYQLQIVTRDAERYKPFT